MHQNLLNAEFASVWHLNAKNENVHVIRVIKLVIPCGLCRRSIFLSFWLVQNLSCDPEQVGRIPDKRE